MPPSSHIRALSGLYRDSHPILGNFDLPVEVENPSRISGTQNLKRDGWSEEKCRNYLITSLGWVPRNHDYQDGLKIIHPLLQQAFGDENMDLSCGVLEELIEVESFTPFPEAMYQRWKHHHMKRREDLRLPHAPHTTTIVGPVAITQALDEWRADHPVAPCLVRRPVSSGSSIKISPTQPTFSAIAHRPAWQIENSMFVSIGGEKANTLHCPTPEQFHKQLWDPNFGRGGILVGVRSVPIESPNSKRKRQGPYEESEDGKSSLASRSKEKSKREGVAGPQIPAEDSNTPSKGPMKKLPRDELRDRFTANITQKSSTSHHKDRDNQKTQSAKSNKHTAKEHRKRPSELSTTLSDRKGVIENVPLPIGARVPHGSFARKHQLVLEGEQLPPFLEVRAEMTVDELSMRQCAQLCGHAMRKVEPIQRSRNLSDYEKRLAQDEVVKEVLLRYKGPPSPGLFFDGGLDFSWEPYPPAAVEKNYILQPTVFLGNTKKAALDSQEKSLKSVKSLISQDHQTRENRSPGRLNEQVGGERQLTRLSNSSLFSFFQPNKQIAPNEAELNAGIELGGTFPRRAAAQLEDHSRTGPHLEMMHPLPAQSMNEDDFAYKNRASTSSRSYQLPAMRLNEPSSAANVPKSPMSDSDSKLYLEMKPLPPLPGEVLGFASFDGLFEGYETSSENNNNNTNCNALGIQPLPPSNFNSTISGNNTSDKATTAYPMALNPSYERLPDYSPSIPAPRPLNIQKQHDIVRIDPGPQRKNDHITYNNSPEESVYPTRTSSLVSSEPPRVSASSYETDTGSRNSFSNAPRSTVSSFEAKYSSDTSSAIMGDFIPLGAPQSNKQMPMADRNAPVDVPTIYRKNAPAGNPYTFEPGTPLFDDAGNTATTGFFSPHQETTPRLTHSKNSRSESNRAFVGRNPTPIHLPPVNTSSRAIHRSESSPNIAPGPFLSRQNSTPSPKLPRYYAEDEGSNIPIRRGRERDEDVVYQPERYRERNARSPVRRYPYQHSGGSSIQSSNSSQRQNYAAQCHSASSVYDRSKNFTPTKGLGDVTEQHEPDMPYSEPSRGRGRAVTPPKRRARSPMKKMFGENGWLGSSPNEAIASNPPKRSRSPMKKIFGERSTPHSQGTSSRSKKTLMGKIKDKIDGLSDKADSSPSRNRRSDNEKHPKLALLSISVEPAEQARIYAEVELMLVHTANKFLMNEFCQGRMAVDSIKKAVDSWKNKGRPAVLEFMYDQTTQRDIVVANQHNFRFHGDRAGDPIRIASMLHNWKYVASIMAVRNFCSPDTVLLKLLFDIEQVLELLGGVEQIMLRLQQIRVSANETMRVARLGKAAHEVPKGRALVYDMATSTDYPPRGASMDDGYGGMKLVPDDYVDRNLL